MRKNKNHKEIQHQTTELNRENGHKRGQRERGRSTPEMKRHVARQVSFESDNNAKLKQVDEASEWWKGMTGENTWGKKRKGTNVAFEIFTKCPPETVQGISLSSLIPFTQRIIIIKETK